jgi:hypothetical protein
MATAPAPTRAELEQALNSDERTLLAELGTYGTDATPRDPVEKGVRIFTALSRKLKTNICSSEELRRLVEDEAEELTLAVALADLVATMSHQIPAATVTALILKTGLYRYCDDLWE